jgi:hypothetical protein
MKPANHRKTPTTTEKTTSNTNNRTTNNKESKNTLCRDYRLKACGYAHYAFAVVDDCCWSVNCAAFEFYDVCA